MSNKGVGLHYVRGSVERKKALHCTHACVLMHRLCNGSDVNIVKLDAKGIIRLFLGYCEGTKAYRLMCL